MLRCNNETPEKDEFIETRSWDALDETLRDLLEKHHEWRQTGAESKYDGYGIEGFQKAHLRYREELDAYIEKKIRTWMEIHPPTYQ